MLVLKFDVDLWVGGIKGRRWRRGLVEVAANGDAAGCRGRGGGIPDLQIAEETGCHRTGGVGLQSLHAQSFQVG
jgi:hypothetical protein